MKCGLSGTENRDYGRRDSSRWPLGTLYPQKVGTNFADKWRSLGQHSSHADSGQRVFFCHEDVEGSGLIDPRFNLSNTMRRGQFHALAALSLKKKPGYPLDSRLGEPQCRYGLCGGKKKFETTGTRTPTTRSSSPYPVAISTALTRFPQ
jgi:hypothetical protein